MKKRAYFILLSSILCLTTYHHGVYAQSSPELIVKQYIDSLLNHDSEQLESITCEADQGRLAQINLGVWEDNQNTLVLAVNAANLTYTIIQQNEGWAQVKVAGTIQVEITGLDDSVRLSPAALDLDTFWPVYENGRWKACTTPPANMAATWAPDRVAREFLTAAFTGNYDGVQVLLCEEQRGILTREQYNIMFQDFLKGEVSLNLDDVTFKVTEQTAAEALVDVSGLIVLSWDRTSETLTLTTSQMGLGTIRLIDKNGWKICQPSPVES